MSTPTNITKIQKSAQLGALTFVAIITSMLLVGAIVVPKLIDRVEQNYLLTQADVNARQARSFSRYAQSRLKEGITQREVRHELQRLMEGGDAELGYSCAINQKSSEYICHPMAQAVGMSVSSKQAAFAKIGDSEREPWETAIARGVEGSGTLLYPDLNSEIVHMEHVPGTDWTISTHENTLAMQAKLEDLRNSLFVGSGLIGLIFAIPASLAARAVSRRHERQIEAEQVRSERLLLNILPAPIAERLKAKEQVIADRHCKVTVLFADITGFTVTAAQTSAEELVEWLNRVFSSFDDICERYGLEKIKTIGDAYMLCGGLGDTNPKEAAVNVIRAAQEMIRTMEALPLQEGQPPMRLRIGVHTGEMVAGVIGKRKFSYDIWGDAVNTASRMESHGQPGRIQISSETAALIADTFTVETRGKIPIKGKGEIEVSMVAIDSKS